MAVTGKIGEATGPLLVLLDTAYNQASWHADLRLLDAMHRHLRAAVAATPPRELNTRLPGGTVTRLRLITGAAAHDLYHAGQIQLLKKFHSRRRAGR